MRAWVTFYDCTSVNRSACDCANWLAVGSHQLLSVICFNILHTRTHISRV